MALTIATGFVVDDAIVMIENISRYIEEGEPPLQAALKGSEQIGFTIISLTVSLIAVLIPLLFMGDVVGRLFREFAITLAVDDRDLGGGVADPGADAVRQAAAPPAGRASSAGSSAAPSAASTGSSRRYDRALDWVLDHQPLTLLVAVAHAGADRAVSTSSIPKGFFPVQDTGLIQGISEARADRSRIAAMAERQQALAAAILKDPDVVSLSSFIGVDGTNTDAEHAAAS